MVITFHETADATAVVASSSEQDAYVDVHGCRAAKAVCLPSLDCVGWLLARVEMDGCEPQLEVCAVTPTCHQCSLPPKIFCSVYHGIRFDTVSGLYRFAVVA
jgi:hypothetical protein